MALAIMEQEDLELFISQSVEKAFRKMILTKAEATTDESGLINIDQAAKILNVSISTMHAYKRDGVIPFHRIGRRVYFRESEILASLKKIN